MVEREETCKALGRTHFQDKRNDQVQQKKNIKQKQKKF